MFPDSICFFHFFQKNDYNTNSVYDMDGDACYDVLGKSGWTLQNFTFQDNLTVPCEFGEDESIQTVFVQTCFAWRTAGEYIYFFIIYTYIYNFYLRSTNQPGRIIYCYFY